MRTFAIVVAADEGRGIGKDGGLPWRLKGELAYFKRLTSDAPEGRRNAVIMGRRTYESLPQKVRPLPARLNVVLSRSADSRKDSADVLQRTSLEEALRALDRRADVAQVFVVGGSEVYRAALLNPSCTRVYITRVHHRFDSDVRLAPFEERFSLVTRDGPHDEGGIRYTFEVYDRLGGST